jgi:hypothetical protein
VIQNAKARIFLMVIFMFDVKWLIKVIENGSQYSISNKNDSHLIK